MFSGGNRVNQKFFKIFETIMRKPRLTTGGAFLLSENVHLIKKVIEITG